MKKKENKPFKQFFETYVSKPLAASTAIIPGFYLFQLKSAKQLGQAAPKFNLFTAFKDGFKASPTIGLIVGTQMIAQEKIESKIHEVGVEKGLPSTVISATSVGLVSAPFLAAFNGQTMGYTPFQAIRNMTLKQTCAITAREALAVLALNKSKDVSGYTKKQLGDNKAVEYGTAFVVGAAASVASHPCDAALTLWQKKIAIQSMKQLSKGVMARGGACGLFTALYLASKDTIDHGVSKV
jgi:hypothetical protein